MAERAKITAKTPETKRGDSISHTRNINLTKPLSSPIDHIMHLQRTIGNQAVQRLFKSGAIHAKLRIGQPNDIYEQEADRVADEVMRMPDKQHIADSPLRSIADSSTSHIIDHKPSGGGQPLPEPVRAFFEPRFGYDFSQVRVHMDVEAAESARVLNAQAYTVGQDIVFGTGQYAVETANGRRLLAHELTHVAQQPETSARVIRREEEPTRRQIARDTHLRRLAVWPN